MTYAMKVLIALDQLANAIAGGHPDETFSARAHRNGWKRTERFINFLFQDDSHCAMSYVSEMRGTQNAQEYRE